LARYDATSGFIGAAQALVGPTLMAHGSPEQQERYLGPLLSGEEWWCQLFSEPGAGSDLAALATRAVRDGDEWVVNGQKVWTSSAQHADFGILLARTDPDAPKHEGITFFIVDMRSPGIEVRPLVQAQGVAHFNEVFLTDVRIPHENVVGEVGGGWKVARTTLRSESSMISGAGQATTFDAVLSTARRCGRTDDPIVRQELARVWTDEHVLRWMGWRTQTAVMTGRKELALHGSLLKNFFTRALRRRVELGLAIEGAEGMLWADAEGEGFWQYQCLNQFASRIGGGTEEVHRNNLGEQALGLPREPAVDRDVPWSATRRSRTIPASPFCVPEVRGHPHFRDPERVGQNGSGSAGRGDGGADVMLEGRTAMVTGVGPGMGRDISLGLAREGADVILVARSDRVVPDVAK